MTTLANLSRAAAAGLFALLLLNCSTMQEIKEGDMLDRARSDYGRALQWSRFESALRFTPGGASGSVAAKARDYNGIKVTYYDDLELQVNEKEGVAHSTVEIRYYYETDLVEKTLTDRQTWKLDREEKKWFLDSGLPAFR